MERRSEMARSMFAATWTSPDQVDRLWSMRSMSPGAWTTDINQELPSLVAWSGWSGPRRGWRNSAA
jgi:hypothetical protein